MKANTQKIIGLSSKEAEERLKKYGLNKVGKEKRFTDLELFLNQFKSPYILLLLFTAILSAILGETIDALVIITIVLLGSILDFWQERGAHRTVEKLLSMIKTYVNVIRDGKETEIPIEYVVPDDIIVLRAGDMVPADGVLLEAKDIFINESLLTGEPYPVEKFANDKVFMGTYVVSGFGIMKTVKTAKDTEYGKMRYRVEQLFGSIKQKIGSSFKLLREDLARKASIACAILWNFWVAYNLFIFFYFYYFCPGILHYS
jgi:Mg2+-importing ATPase